ncbi:hypothetical protein H0E87_029190 [Populus deltoides]|uniref:Uncharacterized protein n=1 Tax=Populus deltoides TaxID=3696 RepID=A0A8T2WM40_POPDE|nr:hypothetical protein H0E87_029190 [Populus deltoides]
MGNMIVNTVHNDLNKENLQELLWTYGFSTTSQGKPLMVVDGVYQTVVYESPRQVCYTCGRVGIAVFFVHQKLLLAKEIPMVRRRQAHIRIKFRRWNHHTAIVLQMTVVSTVRGYMLSLIHTVHNKAISTSKKLNSIGKTGSQMSNLIPDSAEAPSDQTGKLIFVDVANDTETKLPIAPNDEGRASLLIKRMGIKR